MTEVSAAQALSYRQLSVTFATDAGSVRAVDDVTFDVHPGEVLAVVGESGSGKSVSARAAIGLLPDTARVSGVVELGGRDVAGLSDKQFTALRGKDIAMVFQEPGAALDPLFTVGYQIAEAVRAHTDLDRNWSAVVQIKENQHLVTQGIYSSIRHPIYSAHLLWGLTQVLMVPNWLAGVPGFAAIVLIMILRIPHEERMLIGQFGDEYRQYMQQTGALLPRFSNRGARKE